MIGSQILNYQIKSLLGDGGMGTVYLAEHVKLGRKVAIKVLHSHLASNDSIRNRFVNEAKTMAELQHPNIVSLLDYHEDNFGLYLIMEFIDGQPLDEYIEKVSGPIPEEKAILLFKQALAAFQYAHSKGVVHRDIKPSNLIITKDNKLKVLDFGIAKLVGNSNYNLTKTGAHTGTVYYMSPEQVKGLEVDYKSDIYSLGITFYQMLTGYNPYSDLTTEYDIFEKIVKVPLADPRTKYPAVTDHMCKVIDKSTQKDPQARFTDCDEFSNSLDNENSADLNLPKATSLPLIEKEKKRNLKAIYFVIPILLVGLIAGGWFFYNKYYDNTVITEVSGPTNIDSINAVLAKHTQDSIAERKTQDSLLLARKTNPTKPLPDPVVNNSGIIKLYVKGTGLDDLRMKLRNQSAAIMKNKEYRPVNIVFSPSRLLVTCDLKPEPTNFTKMVLVFGPLTGCESCDNTIIKNAGSEVLVQKSDANYIYNVISIAE